MFSHGPVTKGFPTAVDLYLIGEEIGPIRFSTSILFFDLVLLSEGRVELAQGRLWTDEPSRSER